MVGEYLQSVTKLGTLVSTALILFLGFWSGLETTASILVCSKRFLFPTRFSNWKYLNVGNAAKQFRHWTHWRIQGGAPGTRAPPWGPKFFHFCAVFGKNVKNNSNFGSWRPPLGKILDPPLEQVWWRFLINMSWIVIHITIWIYVSLQLLVQNRRRKWNFPLNFHTMRKL